MTIYIHFSFSLLFVKALNENLNSYRQYLDAIDKFNFETEDTEKKKKNEDNNDEVDPEDQHNIRLINQAILIETCNQLNELNK